MNKLIVILSILVGVLLVVVSFVYFVLPAHSLPSFIPGYDPTLARHHFTHGIASLLLGLGAFAFAWFASGKKSA